MHAVRSGEAHRGGLHSADLERDIAAGSGRRSSSSTTSSIFTPGNVASGALAGRGLGGGRRLAASAAATAIAPGAARRRAIRADQPGAELRPVPAARDPADGAAHRDRHLRAAMLSARSSARAACGEWLATAGGSPLTGPCRQARALLRHLPAHDGRGPRHHPWPVPRSRSAATPVLIGAAACLLVIAYLSLGALLQLLVAQPRLRPQPDRHHLLAGLRLRRRRLSDAGDGRIRPRLGHRFCRCAGTSRSCSTRRRAACRPQTRSSRSPCWRRWPLVYFGLAWLRLRAVARRPARAGRADPPVAEPRGSGIAGAFADEYGRVLARSRRLRPDRARADPLWRALPAALSRTADSRHADRRRRRRLTRS